MPALFPPKESLYFLFCFYDTFRRHDPRLESGKEPIDVCLREEWLGTSCAGSSSGGVHLEKMLILSNHRRALGPWSSSSLPSVRHVSHIGAGWRPRESAHRIPSCCPAPVWLSSSSGSVLSFLQPDLLHDHRVGCLLFVSLRYSQVGRQKYHWRELH